MERHYVTSEHWEHNTYRVECACGLTAEIEAIGEAMFSFGRREAHARLIEIHKTHDSGDAKQRA
jgi:hypothetical protein